MCFFCTIHYSFEYAYTRTRGYIKNFILFLLLIILLITFVKKSPSVLFFYIFLPCQIKGNNYNINDYGN